MTSPAAPNNDLWNNIRTHLYYFEETANVFGIRPITLSLDDITDDTVRQQAHFALLEKFDIWEEHPDQNHVLIKIPEAQREAVTQFLKRSGIPNTTDDTLFKSPQDIAERIKKAPDSIRQEGKTVSDLVPAITTSSESVAAASSPVEQKKEVDSETRQETVQQQEREVTAPSFVNALAASAPPASPATMPISQFMVKIAAATTMLDADRPIDDTLSTLLAIRRLAEQAAPNLPVPAHAPPEPSENLTHFARNAQRAALRTQAKQQEEAMFLDETRIALESCPPDERAQLCQQIVQSQFERATLGGYAISTEKSNRGVYYITIRPTGENGANTNNWKNRSKAITDILSMLLAQDKNAQPLSCHHRRIELKLPSEHPAQPLLEALNSSRQTFLSYTT